GLGLGSQMQGLRWGGAEVAYPTYLAPGILAYTAFMTAFFQSLFSAYVRMHYQKTWEGQLTSQVRLEHVVWGEALWATTMGTAYAFVVCLVLAAFGLAGVVDLHWTLAPLAFPVIFLAGLAFAAAGLFFTAILPSMDHMSLPMYLLITPLGFTSSTYFPLPDVPWLAAVVQGNPLHHLAEGLRWLLVEGRPTGHLAWSAGLSVVMLVVLIPIDMRLLRRRVFGDR
ncbi:MAG: ABC transporter permease, partial [bacterium]